MPTDIAAAAAAPPVTPPPVLAAVAVVNVPTSASPSDVPQQMDCLSPGAKGSDDDVYEFREPEPFEFEVRARRESPFSEDKTHRFVHKNKEKEEESSPKKSTPSSPVTFVLTLFDSIFYTYTPSPSSGVFISSADIFFLVLSIDPSYLKKFKLLFHFLLKRKKILFDFFSISWDSNLTKSS